MNRQFDSGLRMAVVTAIMVGCVGVSWGEGQGGGARAARASELAAARAAARAETEAKIAEAKEKRGEAKDRIEDAKTKREAAREKAQTRIEEAKAKAAENKAKLSEAGSARVDTRQDNQEKRIQHGINKGYLTAGEIAKLNAQQQSIATLESSFKSDGKLTGNEFRQLVTELNEASRCIWGEKHDTDGNQMATYRLGKNVFAKSNLTSKMADENLSAAEAKALLKDFRRTVELKRLLSGDLSESERARLQAEYDGLLNTYFEVR